MSDKYPRINIETFIQNLGAWEDPENVGKVIRSMIESTDKWHDGSKLKVMRKFICKYCPFVMDDLDDLIRILKKQNVAGKELIKKLRVYVSNELVDVCSDESLKQLNKLKNKFSDEDLKDIILLMMQQKNGRFGWRFLDSISKSWTDDKLQAIVKLIVGDEEFDDIGGGGDCGLFEVFPYLHDHITIRQVMDHEESDSAGSLVDFIEDDMEDGDDDEDEDDSDSSSSDYNSVVDISEESSDYDSDEKREVEVDEKKGAKKRKVIVISDSE
ncbi:hypothetical protein AV274_4802 [Blastocystis sp. ATCC 50177/Nand II]|uniref:Uncharacterized protein n=1 Tax=Blastocystis sp. subtype 1 (strain ATCC 50177 / NandII) TaxID=478820 RepID=A0A196S908_BLAHN|nr:hypothetical protein AV274_4802 [Blastocystis sp. ATCC 50177/Nand II]